MALKTLCKRQQKTVNSDAWDIRKKGDQPYYCHSYYLGKEAKTEKHKIFKDKYDKTYSVKTTTHCLEKLTKT